MSEGYQPDLIVRKNNALRWLLIAVLAGALVYSWVAQDRAYKKLGPIPASGGKYFKTRLEIPGPRFAQGDDRWGEDLLGPTDGTLAAEGCAVCSAAMVLASYGVDIDPKRLNSYLTENSGYTPQGWIYWEKAAELSSGKARHVYEDLPSFKLIDDNLRKGNPVIVRIRLDSGITHFLVIAGKDGYDYLARDPAGRGSEGLYPLKDLGKKIEALRFYEKL